MNNPSQNQYLSNFKKFLLMNSLAFLGYLTILIWTLSWTNSGFAFWYIIGLCIFHLLTATPIYNHYTKTILQCTDHKLNFHSTINNIILVGYTGTGKSTLLAKYQARALTSTKLLDGIKLKNELQCRLTEAEITEFKQCDVLILDAVIAALCFPTISPALSNIQEILDFRYSNKKITVIAEQSIKDINHMSIAKKMLKHYYYIELVQLADTNQALSELSTIINYNNLKQKIRNSSTPITLIYKLRLKIIEILHPFNTFSLSREISTTNY